MRGQTTLHVTVVARCPLVRKTYGTDRYKCIMSELQLQQNHHQQQQQQQQQQQCCRYGELVGLDIGIGK